MSGRVFAGARALYRAAGVSGDDMGKKPIIAIANSFDEFLPGHVHLNKVGRIVSEAIKEAGGIPREFNTMAVDDGIAMGHTGMLYSLPSRDIIADTVEYQCNAHCADALICIPNCDKVVPGMLMAALRLNIPTVFVSGGPMEAGTTVLPDGTVTSANFAVHWTKPADTVYNTAGTVKVPGTATVFGKEFKVTATIRVQRSQVTIGSSVSGNALRLTQNIPADKQSDTLDAIKDGSTTVDANTGGGANPSAWTNWAYSKAGHNTAEITFEYATEQQLGQIVMYFFRDSNAVRFPDAGKTKIQISADGKNWTDLAATETIAAQESSDRVKPYTYDFAPVGATFVKVTVTNADTTTPSGVVCTGLTEIELKTATSKFVTNTSAALSSLTVNGTKVSDSVLAAGSYNTPAIIADVKAEGEGNASVTVLPAHDNVIRVITESEDHVTRKTFTINLGTEQEFPADSDERDYPAADMTVTVGSEQTSGTATEGPKKFAVDGNTSTYWHSNWTPTTVNDLWIAFELQKPTKLDALRYLPRPAGSKNGSVTEYKVQVSDDGTNWTDAGSGTWTTDYGWKLAEFNQPVTTKHVRLKAVHTYADSGNDKFMSASEIRLRKAVDTTDISGATVTVPAKLTVDQVDADHPATFATRT